MSLRKNSLRELHSEVDTGPLNDILFILLMFFLMVSTLANPNVIKLSVPKSKSDTKQKQSVVVSVDKNKNLFIRSFMDVMSVRQIFVPFLSLLRLSLAMTPLMKVIWTSYGRKEYLTDSGPQAKWFQDVGIELLLLSAG